MQENAQSERIEIAGQENILPRKPLKRNKPVEVMDITASGSLADICMCFARVIVPMLLTRSRLALDLKRVWVLDNESASTFRVSVSGFDHSVPRP